MIIDALYGKYISFFFFKNMHEDYLPNCFSRYKRTTPPNIFYMEDIFSMIYLMGIFSNLLNKLYYEYVQNQLYDGYTSNRFPVNYYMYTQ